MIAAIVLSLAFVAQAGPIPGGTVVRREIGPEVVVCDECGVREAAVVSAIRCLTTSPRDEAREEAARALGHVKWSCHPEVITALSGALLRDPDWSVREQAAEALTRRGACDPEAHEALARAASRDPKLCVRLKARKGLRVMAGRCEGACAVCEGTTAVVVGPTRRPGPIRSLMPSIDIAVPGTRLHIGPRRPMIVGPPVVIEPPMVEVDPATPIPTPAPAEPDLRPIPRDEDIPPPRPEPTPFGSPLPDPLPERPTSRRSSARPATPDLSRPTAPTPAPGPEPPPLVGPSGSPG